jgi:hypothetical protein
MHFGRLKRRIAVCFSILAILENSLRLEACQKTTGFAKS